MRTAEAKREVKKTYNDAHEWSVLFEVNTFSVHGWLWPNAERKPS